MIKLMRLKILEKGPKKAKLRAIYEKDFDLNFLEIYRLWADYVKERKNIAFFEFTLDEKRNLIEFEVLTKDLDRWLFVTTFLSSVISDLGIERR